MIDNIVNTVNDRAIVNQAAIRQVNESWGKTLGLNQLNCHLKFPGLYNQVHVEQH